ncbi:LAFE_0E13564g1_1 [Lachancea fermentati]|uniref:Clathrin light chain n=1 Tax=Lachancea fermentati TaxID=4955 RepID=A0A1G4ME09_LACFM|nr:LAFE_0E13564g1_1 [Lachancea fermentati]
MSEKFPPLEDDAVTADVPAGEEETDFLKREAELLGDEFKTDQDLDYLQEDKHDDIKEFEDNYPELSEATTEAHATNADDGEDDFGEPQSSSGPTDAGRSEVVAQWREQRVTEIAERDEAERSAKERLQEEAVKHMDDFYDNYNSKKQQQLEATRAEAEKFLQQRDEFISQDNTVWDRVLQLINEDDADIVGERNRSKFKEILVKLKGNEKAPGATRA